MGHEGPAVYAFKDRCCCQHGGISSHGDWARANCARRRLQPRWRALAHEGGAVGLGAARVLLTLVLFGTKRQIDASPNGILTTYIAGLCCDPRIDARDHLRGHAYCNAFLQRWLSPIDHHASKGKARNRIRIHLGVWDATVLQLGTAKNVGGGSDGGVCRLRKSRQRPLIRLWRQASAVRSRRSAGCAGDRNVELQPGTGA